MLEGSGDLRRGEPLRRDQKPRYGPTRQPVSIERAELTSEIGGLHTIPRDQAGFVHQRFEAVFS